MFRSPQGASGLASTCSRLLNLRCHANAPHVIVARSDGLHAALGRGSLTSRKRLDHVCVCKAGQQQAKKQRSKTSTGDKRTKRQQSLSETQTKWNIFSVEEYNRPWQVPWGKKETALGFAAWLFSFLLTSLLTAPLLIQYAGGNVEALTAQQKTIYVLLNQLLEVFIGIWVVRYTLRSFEPLDEDIFGVSWRKPFGRPDGWATWALLGILVAPFAVSATEAVFSAAGYTTLGPSTVDEVTKILAPDGTTFASLFAVTAVLAPVLEEFVFRGFLLASLTSFVPVPVAVLGSSVSFGLAHLSIKDLPELTVLGAVLCCSYIRSRNLLTPVLIHGLWNGTTLAALYVLAQSKSS